MGADSRIRETHSGLPTERRRPGPHGPINGKHAQELLFDIEICKGREKRMTARREKKRTRYKAPLINKDNKVLPVEMISMPLRNADGAVTGVVDAITGVKEKKLWSEQTGGAAKTF